MRDTNRFSNVFEEIISLRRELREAREYAEGFWTLASDFREFMSFSSLEDRELWDKVEAYLARPLPWASAEGEGK